MGGNLTFTLVFDLHFLKMNETNIYFHLINYLVILNTCMWPASLFTKRWPNYISLWGLGSLFPLFLLHDCIKAVSQHCTLGSLDSGRWYTPKLFFFLLLLGDWLAFNNASPFGEVCLGIPNSYHFYFCRYRSLHDPH